MVVLVWAEFELESGIVGGLSVRDSMVVLCCLKVGISMLDFVNH